MASSLLTQALLGNQYGGYGTGSKDPRVIAATGRSRLGQALMGQGLDSSPAYPMEGLARLAQAIVGSFIAREGSSGLEDIAKQDNAAASNAMAFMQGSPPATMVDAPTPPVPQPQPIQGGGTATVSVPNLDPIIQAAAQQNGVPEPLMRAVLQQESSLGTNPAAKGNIGQIIQSTAQNPGFGMAPLAPEDVTNPEKNVGFAAEYLRKRGDAAGVTDWNDPSQWALALKGYNGGGDPNYVANVSRFLPKGTQVASAGNIATDAGGPAPSSPYEAPEIKDALSRIERAQQVLADPRYQYNERAQAAAKAVIEKAKIDLQFSLHTADKANAAATKQEDRRYQEGRENERRVYDESRKIPGTIQMQDPDGKGVGIYEMTPQGPGKRLGSAPKQPGEGAFGGTGMEAQVYNTLLSIGPKITSGTATQQERDQYALAYQHQLNGQIMPVPDPTDPSGQKQVLARIPGAIPPQFPKPDFVPGAAAPQGATPPAASAPTASGAPAPPATPAPASADASAQSAPQVIPGTTRAPADLKLTEDERKAAGFALRMQDASKDIDALEQKGVHTGNWGAAAKAQIPVVGNSLQSPEFQVYQQRAQDWVRAKLRRESGAVIGEQEMADEFKTYFPQPGDSPEKIAAKRRSREAAQLGMDEGAGRARIDPARMPGKEAPAGLPPLPPGFKLVQ